MQSGSLITVMYVIVCTYITTRGAEESNWFNYVFTVAKLATLFCIISVAFFYFDIKNFTPFTIPEKGDWMGTIQGASIVFFSYLGFDFITTLAEETKNPTKDLPVSITSSIVVCMAIYVATAISLSGIARLDVLDPNTAMPQAFATIGVDWVNILDLILI